MINLISENYVEISSWLLATNKNNKLSINGTVVLAKQ